MDLSKSFGRPPPIANWNPVPNEDTPSFPQFPPKALQRNYGTWTELCMPSTGNSRRRRRTLRNRKDSHLSSYKKPKEYTVPNQMEGLPRLRKLLVTSQGTTISTRLVKAISQSPSPDYNYKSSIAGAMEA